MSCIPCCIPEADLTLTWDGSGSGPLWSIAGSAVLTYTPGGPPIGTLWQSPAIPYAGGQTITFYLQCDGGFTALNTVLSLTGPFACWRWVGTFACAAMTGPATCSPYHLQNTSDVSFGNMYVDYP